MIFFAKYFPFIGYNIRLSVVTPVDSLTIIVLLMVGSPPK